MNIFQGWKVKLYAFATLFLFFIGTVAVLMPHDPLLSNQVETIGTNGTNDIKDIPQQDVKGINTLGDDKEVSSDVDPTSRTSSASDEATVETRQADLPQTNSDKPIENENITIQPSPVDQPSLVVEDPKPVDGIVKPPVVVEPPIKCGGCGTILDKTALIRCPMNLDYSTSSYLCRVDQ